MSEHALERARTATKTRRRHRKPRIPRPGGPWWLWLWALVTSVLTYATMAKLHIWAVMILGGIAAACVLPLLTLALAWWQWERQEGLPHVNLGRADRIFLASNLLTDLYFLAILAGAIKVVR